MTDDYEGTFAFTGTLAHVEVDVSGDLLHDDAAELRSIMAHQ